MPPVSPDVWAALHIHGLVHVLINLPHRVEELRLQHLLQRGQLGGGDLQQGLHCSTAAQHGPHLAAVFALLQLLQQLAGAPDVAGQRQVAVHLGQAVLRLGHGHCIIIIIIIIITMMTTAGPTFPCCPWLLELY